MQLHAHEADHRCSRKITSGGFGYSEMHKIKTSARTCVLKYTCLSMRADTHACAKPFTNAAGGRSDGSACENRWVGEIEGKNPPSESAEAKPPEEQQQPNSVFPQPHYARSQNGVGKSV